MTQKPSRHPPRIIIGARCYADALPAIHVGTDLAAQLGANILAILAEDDAIHRVAALPFSRAFCLPAGTPVAITPGAMRSAVAGDARIMRKTLARLADAASVRWSFQHRQGNILQSLRDMAVAGDLLLVGHQRARRESGEIVLMDRTDPIEPRLLNLGLHLARSSGRTLRLFVPAASAETLQDQIRGGSAGDTALPDIKIDDAADQARFRSCLTRERPFVLLFAASAAQGQDIETIIGQARCPVVLAMDQPEAAPAQ